MKAIAGATGSGDMKHPAGSYVMPNMIVMETPSDTLTFQPKHQAHNVSVCSTAIIWLV
jgi:hypothetical protein